MKTFTATFSTEFAKKTGIAPLWILKLTVATVDYYLSDSAFTVAGWNGGITTKAWIASWGRLREAISGSLGEIRVGDFDCSLLVDATAATDAIDLATDSTFEKSTATLYLWAAGLNATTDPPKAMFAGTIRDVDIPDELTVNLVIEDASTRLQDLMLGVVVTAATWPKADPDDIGKILPIVYGTVKNIPAPALYAGKLTSLKGALTNVATSVSFVDPTGIAANMTIKVDSEYIRITAGTANPFTCSRAYTGGGAAAAHVDGALAVEVVSSPYVFAAADAPVTAIDRVRCRTSEGRDVDVTDLCTRYTGTGADDYSGYTDRAVATITSAQAASILARVQAAAGAIAVTDPGHLHSQAVQVVSIHPDTGAPNNALNYGLSVGTVWGWIDRDFSTSGIIALSPPDRTQRLTHNLALGQAGVPERVRICVNAENYQSGAGSLVVNGKCCNTAVTVTHSAVAVSTVKSGWYTLTAGKTWADFIDNAQTYIDVNDTTINYRVYEVWWEVEVDPSTSSVTTGLSVSGNSAADLALGGRIIVDVTRGITAPDLVIADILTRYCGGLSSSKVGSFPAGYRIDGVLLEARSALEVLNRIAFESRAWFRLVAGAGVVTVRPSTLTSARTLAACRLGSDHRKVHSRKKAAIDDVLNKIVMRYNRDNDTRGDADENWLAVLTSEDATSQTDYGIRQRDELFKMLWVTDPTMAASVIAFYLLFYKRRRWRHEFEVFLDQADLEFGDVITLGFAGSAVGEITEAGYQPGGTASIDTIALVVEA